MTEDVIELTLMNGCIGLHGQYVACSVCGEQKLLVLVADPDERESVDPAYVRCPHGHIWPEPAVPRRAVTAFIDAVAAEDYDAWRAALVHLRNHGALMVPVSEVTLRLLS